MSPEPFDRDIDEFLAGDGGGDLDIDKIFAKDFDRVWAEALRYEPEALVPESEPRPSLINPALHYRDIAAGVVLFDADGPIGGYIGCDLSLDAAYQGEGLGAEIVIERCLRDAASPVWALDTAAYSPAGLAAHEAAWRRVRDNPGETARRVARLSPLPIAA